ncbi:RHS repeat domain-containing protein [Lysinibacillus sp. 3P01SB]|uniref:RHS repeat domain-containing protein n=1 Tax=Lysinibacillus sp. 3P01SB TaxID=3132284 RepID=UPI0039A6D696
MEERYSNGTTISYDYAPAGNRTNKTVTKYGLTTTTAYEYDAANRMKKAGSQVYEVDDNGNLKNDGRYQYVWNAFDQLTEVKTISGAAVASYRYDDQGRRVYSKNQNGETYYRYNGTSNQVLFEENANGTITKAYTYDDNGHPLTMTYEGKTYYYLTNYRGDILTMTDIYGAVVAEYAYDAWGNILTQSGIMAATNPYRYAGYRYDEQTKLYYLMARYYNPDTGVFLSLDPVRGDMKNPLTMNGYNYANNNPVMNVDPDGEAAISTAVKRVKNAVLYALGIWLGMYINPSSLALLLTSASLFGEKIVNGVWGSIKKYVNNKISTTSLINQTKQVIKDSRKEQQQLIKNIKNTVRKHNAKLAAKIFIKGFFTPVDRTIVLGAFGWGLYKNYGWKNAF